MEFVRHRVFSFTQESTRYCNYSKDKHGNELTFILPCWIEDDQLDNFNVLVEMANTCNKDVYTLGHDENLPMEFRALCSYVYDMSNAEHGYNFQIKAGWKPQQARAVLPNSLKTELIMTGFISDWRHFFHLRTAHGAHPQAKELATPLQEEFTNLGLL